MVPHLRDLADRSISRLKTEASQAMKFAKDNPLDGAAVHKAVELSAKLEGYKQAVMDTIGILEVLVEVGPPRA